MELAAYTKAYHAWLLSPESAHYMQKHKRTHDLEQATIAHRVWETKDQSLFYPDIAQKPDPKLQPTDWMQMAGLDAMLQFTDECETRQREQPWDICLRPEITLDIDRERCRIHLKELKVSHPINVVLPNVSRDTLNIEQCLGYDLIL